MTKPSMESGKQSSSSAQSLRAAWNLPGPGGILVRILALSLLWWILTEGKAFSILGLLGIVLAVLASFLLLPPRSWPLRPLAVVRFLAYFLWQSLLGGLDVALRAMRFRVDVTPTMITHVFSLQSEPARVLFLWVVSLLPGTAAVDIHGDYARIHALDQRLADPAILRELEWRIAALSHP